MEETFMGIFALLSALLAGFCLFILPAVAMEVLDRVLPLFENIPLTWTMSLQEWFYNTAADIYEYFKDKEEEIGRHRKLTEDSFSVWLQENIEIQEGRRMPVSING